jgi:DNA-binding NarL/FixJ family response regulator
MTHLLFLPDDQTFILLDSPLPADELIASINSGQWIPPNAIESVLQGAGGSPAGLFLKAACFGKLVVVTLTEPLAAPLPQAGQTEQNGFGRLSRRQTQVLQCLIEGLTTHQIALRLGLHPRTVQYHITFIKTYFQAGTRAESIGRAVGSGLFKAHAGVPAPKYAKRKWKSDYDKG